MALLPDASKPLTIGLLLFSALAVAVGQGLVLANAELVASVPGAVKSGLGSEAGDRLVRGLVTVGVIYVLSQALGIQRLVIGLLIRRIDLRLQRRLMEATMGPLGVAHLEDPSTLDKLSRATGSTQGWTVASSVNGLVSAVQFKLHTLAAAVMVALHFHPWLAVAMMTGRLIGIPLRQRQLQKVADTVSGRTGALRRSDYLRSLALTPPAAKELRIFGMSEWLLERFHRTWVQTMDLIWKDRNKSGKVMFLVLLPLTALVMGLPLVIVGVAAARNQIGLESLAILVQPILVLGSFASFGLSRETTIAYGAAALPAVKDLEASSAENRLRWTGTLDPAGLPRRDIVFQNVRFRYPGSNREIFSDLNLVIPAGKSLAIVGENGAGKTTLVKLLARMYEPIDGAILVDGINLSEIDPYAWQRRVGAIFQDFLRLHLTLAENVAFGAIHKGVDQNLLELVSQRAGASSLISALPNGFDTILSRQYTGGADLSEGQWQKVALARALYSAEGGAGILVLDEPTASLDVKAETELFDRFLEITENVTTLVISHRFSTVRRADRICVLADGGVVEEGTHEELMTRAGRYAHLFTLQASRYKQEAEP